MTTKTPNLQNLKTKLSSLTPEDTEKISAHLNALVTSATVIGLMFKSRRAAKAGEWNKATYYAVAVMSGQAALRYRLDDMRRKGFLK